MKTTLKQFIFLASMVCLMNVRAQTLTWQWAKSAGLTGNEYAYASVLDASGNLYVIGEYSSANITFGSITLTNLGAAYTSDIFVVKYSPAGAALWAKTFGGPSGDVGHSIAIDPSGNIYITGWFTSPNLVMGTYTINNVSSPSSDVFVAKMDASGNVLWVKGAGGNNNDRGYGIAVDASGNVFTTGGFSSPAINFSPGILTNAGSGTDDFFIAKYDSNGNTQWARGAGGTNVETGYSAATDSSGNVYVTGKFVSASVDFGTGPLPNATTGSGDVFVTKYTAAGTATWSAAYGGTQDDYGNAIAVWKKSVYVTGGYNSPLMSVGSTTITNAVPGTSDIFLAQFNDNGVPQWTKKSGGGDSEAGNGITTDSAGNVFIVGYFISSSLSFGTNIVNNFSANYRDLYVAAYDGFGSALWATEVGNTYDETANCISVNGNATEVYVGGTFNSGGVSFGTNMITKGCGDDVFVAKLQAPAVGIKEFSMQDISSIYPNPNNGKFRVTAQGQIIFYNVFGEQVMSKIINNSFGENEFDFSAMQKGVYLYRIFSEGNKILTGRVVIE